MVCSGKQGVAHTVAQASSRQNGATEYGAALASAPSNSKTLVLICSSDPHDESHGRETAKSETQIGVPVWQRGQRWISMPISASINSSGER